MAELQAVILAAGQGTRMKSGMPKVLQAVAGKAMVDHVIDAARAAGAARLVVIIGYEAARMRRHFAEADVQLAEQTPQLGTGHAVLQAIPLLQSESGEVLVLNGDAPLIESEPLAELVRRHRAAKAHVSFLAATVDEPAKLGRVIRDSDRVRIREWADATEGERAGHEVNAGIYCFDAAWLAAELPKLRPSPTKGEYYLTDLIERAPKAIAVATDALIADCIGVDSRQVLALAERVMQERLRAKWMDEGVTFIDPSSVFLDSETRIGQDTVIYPRVLLEKATIGRGCTLGPGSRIQDSRVGDGSAVRESVLESAIVEDGVEVGPFSHLRPGAYVERGAKLGNYVEIKNARIGRDTQIHHFSYTGDADIGRHVNIGAGTITCNYDSETRIKSRTIVEDGASTGSDTLLVAPVTIGARAVTASGAVVTHDVAPDTLVMGVPARPVRQVRKGGTEHEH